MNNPEGALPDFDLFALPDGYYENPWPWFARLRDHDPVHQNHDGSVLVTRHKDVWTIWRHPGGLVDKSAQFAQRFGDGPLLEHHTTSMLFRDPPDHDRLRATVKLFFDSKALSRLSERVERIANELIALAIERRQVNFVKDIAAELPLRIMCFLLGVPESDKALLHDLGGKILFPLNPTVDRMHIDEGHSAALHFRDYLINVIATVRPDPDAETVVGCLAYHVGTHSISLNEAAHMCILLFNGGHETTTNLLSVGLHSLLEQPDELERLRLTDQLDGTAVDELTRFVSPLQLQGRRIQADITLSTTTLMAGTEVVISQASANHDDRVFYNGDSLDVGRRPNNHIAFGAGVHLCIGRLLARMEATALLPKLVRAVNIERCGEPIFNRNARFRGLAQLPLELTPRKQNLS